MDTLLFYTTKSCGLTDNSGAGFVGIPKGIIGAVLLGSRIDQGIRARVVQACADYDGEVEIVQAKLDPDVYGLGFDLETTA